MYAFERHYFLMNHRLPLSLSSPDKDFICTGFLHAKKFLKGLSDRLGVRLEAPLCSLMSYFCQPVFSSKAFSIMHVTYRLCSLHAPKVDCLTVESPERVYLRLAGFLFRLVQLGYNTLNKHSCRICCEHTFYSFANVAP